MKKKSPPEARALRKRAEQTLQKSSERGQSSRISHELDVHRVELELQNEELKTARGALEAALERYTEVFDFAPIGYATLSLAGVIRELNHAGGVVLGEERSRLVGRRLIEHVARESRTAFQSLLSDAIERQLPVSVELHLERHEQMVPVRLTAAALRKREQTILVAFEDITERREREQVLARTEQALREANQRKDEFIAMLSHELRNPLTPILTSVEALRLGGRDPVMFEQTLGIIDRSATHLVRLIDDLLDITRITRGKVRLERAPVDLVALVRATVDDYRRTFQARALRLEIRLPTREVWLLADRERLFQALTNVLGNAEKFTPSGGTVTVAVDALEGNAILRVSDTGIGIAHDVLDSVFEPFSQAPQALDRKHGGVGLGLALVKGITELHGGRVSIWSPGIGRGTDITIQLPLTELRPQQTTATPAPVARPRRILIVEDKVDVAESLRYALALKGHTVEAAYDGHAALALAHTFRPEIVLCDLGLPDIDGYALAKQFRADRDLCEVYLVALSGYARPEDIARSQEAGFEHHVAKPPRLDEIDMILAHAKAPTRPNVLH